MQIVYEALLKSERSDEDKIVYAIDMLLVDEYGICDDLLWLVIGIGRRPRGRAWLIGWENDSMISNKWLQRIETSGTRTIGGSS